MEQKNPQVVLHTSHGEVTVELFAQQAPASTENFLAYAREGYYDGTIFHRVIGNFMIQGGGLTPDMQNKKTKAPIKNEADNGLKNERGTLAMARTQVVDSATSQFFINVTDNDFLNHRDKTPNGYGYAVFGKVVQGMDVVDAIRKVPTGNAGFHQDVPKEPVLIEKAEVLNEGA
ncbi:peptidylprolyl isomerase [Geoalkalibacter halelectricus]|uniref:Peptidyl-prolyl cis-trans isomerase n=1 Tax=Geoalkalibacter halelectricus TaxID=2847045 RepID=A0ABY5ZQS4_9BACT|nr:peptidylprolyl isomerase [Geoalkalibacter halelectricus]MDO3376966.1 peptidylprolyl isomerase [Geoalkalibacter halelectricus]UWZ81189.1 peptidyl-prolyl cis-trans isomerase [Geoalkalibacter halelectricus]